MNGLVKGMRPPELLKFGPLIGPISTRLDTFDFVEPCFSNMADDEEAVVLVCTSLVFCALSVHVNKTEKDDTLCGWNTI